MELRLTRHARMRMRLRSVTRTQVEAAIRQARRIEVGATAIVYTAVVGGRSIQVVAARGRSPILVITVQIERDGEGS